MENERFVEARCFKKKEMGVSPRRGANFSKFDLRNRSPHNPPPSKKKKGRGDYGNNHPFL